MPSLRRLAVVVALLAVCGAAAGFAQYAEQNVNMVAGTSWPHGDPFLQRQNEPSVATSTRNPLHLLAGANDYRSVDIPFDTPPSPDNEERGDAWVGVFKSRNGGQTWWSDLLDGYPQQTTSTSPLHGYQAGADPIVRSGPNGMFYYAGLVLNRDPNPLSGIFVARFIDDNRTENGDPFVSLGAQMIDHGSSGAFLDKPWLAVGPGSGTCTVNGETFAAQNVYVAYTTFVGNDNNIRTKLMFARSTDCGATWSAPQKLSEGYPINQGAQIVVSPTGPVYVVWRMFKSGSTPDSIMVAKSIDNGATFTKAAVVKTINPFEQGMTPTSIRTNAYPAATADASGRLYVVWADRGFQANGDGRIVMMHSTDLVTWTGPIVVDGAAQRGHQFMPAITNAGGRIVVTYYDLRDDSTQGIFTSNHDGTYNETRNPVGDRLLNPSPVWGQYLQEYANEARRHTLDLRAIEANASVVGPSFTGVARISRYVFGSRQGSTLIEQLQYNVPNLPLFRLGTTPFLGDYIDVAGYSPKSSPVFHIAWTDNRDVRPPLDGNWANYTPVFSPSNSGTSIFSGGTVPACAVGQTGMRNQNIYTSRVTDGVFAGSTGNSKPLTIQRAFAVFVQNATGQSKTFRLTIATPPPGGNASFDQFTVPSSYPTFVDVAIPPHSTATRSVYVSSSDLHATVNVDVTEVGGSLSTAVVINPDVTNPDVTNPDVTNPDVTNPDVTNPDVTNPDVTNSDVHTPDVTNPDVTNPDVTNPDVTNPDVTNPDVTNPDVTNPDVTNPDVTNPDVTNPDVTNPDVTNSSVTDTTWTIHNKGNTTSGYNVKLVSSQPIPAGVQTQLIINRVYQTPTAKNCTLTVEKHYQILSNVINPTFTDSGQLFTPNPNDSSVTLVPGDAARLTLRVYIKSGSGATFDAASAVTPVVIAQANNNVAGVIASSPSVASSLPVITTATVNDAVSGKPYSTQFAAVGGKAPYTWSATPGTIDSTGLYSNTFQTTDSQTAISVTVTDADGATFTKLFIIPVYQPLLITTQSLPDAVMGQPYLATVTATGGKLPYTWAKYKPLSFPAWLSVDSTTGQLTGTPPATGTVLVNVQVTDAANPSQFALQQFQLTIDNPVNVAWNGPVNAIAGQSQQVFVRVTDNQGAVIPGALVKLTLGNNPSGTVFNPLTSTTDATGLAAFQVTIGAPGNGYTLIATVTALGFQGSSTSPSFNIVAPLTINQASLPDGFEGNAYNQTFTASGGGGAQTWTISAPLPAGLTFSSGGTISGTPAEVTFTSFAVTVTDSGSPQQSATKSFTLQTWSFPSAQCQSGTFPLFNNWNTAGVQGGGTPPTAPAKGRPNGYTIASMVMYHLDVPTLDTVQISMIGINSADLGPWSVTVQRFPITTQGFANLIVNVPAGTVMNDASGYIVEDSDPSTWAQNAGSSGQGFTVICVTPN